MATDPRGTRTQRGYNQTHQRARNQWARHVATGNAQCTRCGQPITPGEPWHLDHTADRTGYLGAAHPSCNSAAFTRRTPPTVRPQPPHPGYNH